MRSNAFAWALALALLSCGKKEAETGAAVEPVANANANANAPANVPANANANAPANANADAASACGAKPLPECPLQAWMKKNTAAAMAAEDMTQAAAALDTIVTFAPAGYTNWVSIARDGAAAARIGHVDAVKAACRGCHDQYRMKYRNEMRARPLP